MANGIGSVAASLFGTAFPTTIYIGHPGWKRLAARSGYSALNGIFITFLCLTGTIQTVLYFIPLEAGLAPFAQSLAIHGMISLERGFIFTSMILAAIGVFLIEREFFRGAYWSLAAAFFAAIGIIHAYELTPGGIATRFGLWEAPEFAISYVLLFVLFFAVGWWERR